MYYLVRTTCYAGHQLALSMRYFQMSVFERLPIGSVMCVYACLGDCRHRPDQGQDPEVGPGPAGHHGEGPQTQGGEES